MDHKFELLSLDLFGAFSLNDAFGLFYGIKKHIELDDIFVELFTD